MAKQEQGIAATVGVMGGGERAVTSEEEQVAVSEGVIEEKSTVKALISDAHFNLPSLVHNPGIFFYLQVWHPTVSEPSEHHVLSTFGIQDTVSCKVIFVYFFDCSSQLLLD